MSNKKVRQLASENKRKATSFMTYDQIDKCHKIIHTASVSAGAAGAIPIPVADAIPITAAQVVMVISLGNVFEREITNTAAKTLLTGVAAPIVGRTVASSLLKLIPVAGWMLSAALAATITEAIGWSIAGSFAKQYQKEIITINKDIMHKDIMRDIERNEILKDDDDDDADDELLEF